MLLELLLGEVAELVEALVVSALRVAVVFLDFEKVVAED